MQPSALERCCRQLAARGSEVLLEVQEEEVVTLSCQPEEGIGSWQAGAADSFPEVLAAYCRLQQLRRDLVAKGRSRARVC